MHLALVMVMTAFARGEQTAQQHHSVKLAQLRSEINRKQSDLNYRETPPPGAAHTPFKDALRIRCSLRVHRSRSLHSRYCPKATSSESGWLSDLLRRAKASCSDMHSGQQIESMLRATLSHPRLSQNASCMREVFVHNDRIARASVESLQRLQALYSTNYPNRNRTPTHPLSSMPR